MNDNQIKKWVPTPLEHRSLGLFGVPHVEGDFKTAPIFGISMFNNNPRINVFTRNPKEEGMQGRFDKPLSKERISIGFSPMVMTLFFKDLQKLFTGDLVVNRRVLRTKGYRAGKSKANGDKMEVTSSIAYGINEGKVYFEVKWYNRDVNRFEFRDEFFHEREDIGSIDNDSNEIFNRELRVEWCQIYIDTIARFIYHSFDVTANDYVPVGERAKPAQNVTPANENGGGQLQQATTDEGDSW